MKLMILCMFLALVLVVFASFASNANTERQLIEESIELAKGYADGQPQERVDQFQPKVFVADTPLNNHEEELARSVVLSTLGKH